jgi:acyl-coenzyme A synthetase/AMP-(fatty) acid ligase/acyl carrier protein
LGTHRGAINRFQWMWKQFPFKKTDVCCIKTSLSFVDSIWECFGPLLAGVPSVVIPDHVVADAEAFIALLAQKRVTRIVVVPSLLDTWVSSGANLQALLPELTLWISSGEALSVRLAEKFASTKPGSSLVNLYGCSEVAADVTWHLCNEFENAGTIPIGRPLDNTQIYILDADLNPTAIGISGEIYVGGFALARGYRAYADATAERFVPNPFSQQAGERLYKTGDLGRYLINGEVEYFGRADHQIKLRGYRIETAEIEHALASHPGVRQVLVTVSGDSVSEKRLVAYVAATESDDIFRHELHNQVARLLPSYMVPSVFVIVDAFPMLTNGKIDRKALPKINRTHTLSAGLNVAPANSLEKALVTIWQEVLGLEAVGVNDNFFDLGGHSLALLQIKAKIQSRIGKEVSLTELFTYPTVSALSRVINDQAPANDIVATARKRSAAQRKALQRNRQNQRERGAAD